MDTKYVKKYPNDRYGYLCKDKIPTRCCNNKLATCLVGFFAVLVFILLASNIYLHIKYLDVSSDLAKQSEIIQYLSSNQGIYHKHHETKELKNRQKQNWHILDRYEKNQTHYGRQHQRRKELIMKPVTQLHADTADTDGRHCTTYHIAGCGNGCGCFTWGLPNDQYANNFNYTKDTSGNKAMVRAIEIKRPGTYLIYSQIAVNGPRLQDNQPSVGYETIKIPRNTESIVVLMKSYLTQDKRGRSYGSNSRALDTQNQMGIFQLNCNDKILVRPTTQTNYGVRYIVEGERSFFGIILINYSSQFVRDDDNSCS